MMVDRTQDEWALVCTARQGDKEALQVLLRRNWAWVKALVYSVLAGSSSGLRAGVQDLDDVMQEICLRVITRIHTLREPQRFRAWLAILARREAIRHRRQRGRAVDLRGLCLTEGQHACASVGMAPGTASDMATGGREDSLQGGRENDPAVDIERKELCGRVLEAVAELPEKYREVFVLAQSGELTYAQMAEVLDLPTTTMQIRLLRARRMIRDQIAGTGERKVRENEHCG